MDERTPPRTPAVAPAWMPDVNRRVTNRVQGVWAPHLPPWAMILHIGRRTGRHHETPVLALRRGDCVAIALPYGSRADWVRNVFAAGGCRMKRRGRITDLTNPRVVTGTAEEDLPRTMRLASRRMGVLVMDISAPPN